MNMNLWDTEEMEGGEVEETQGALKEHKGFEGIVSLVMKGWPSCTELLGSGLRIL